MSSRVSVGDTACSRYDAFRIAARPRVDEQQERDVRPVAVARLDRAREREMRARAIAGQRDALRVDVERARVLDEPCERRVRIVVGRRVRALGRAPVMHARDDGIRVARQRRARAVVRREAAGDPAAAVQVEDRGKRPAPGPVDAHGELAAGSAIHVSPRAIPSSGAGKRRCTSSMRVRRASGVVAASGGTSAATRAR
jgi:hypothetical protein